MYESNTESDALVRAEARATARNRQPHVVLSPRERQALELIARGCSYAEVARVQRVTVNTAHSHIRSLYAKLDAHSKTEAVFEAGVLGLLPPGLWGVAYHAPSEHGGQPIERAASHSQRGPGAADLLGRA